MNGHLQLDVSGWMHLPHYGRDSSRRSSSVSNESPDHHALQDNGSSKMSRRGSAASENHPPLVHSTSSPTVLNGTAQPNPPSPSPPPTPSRRPSWLTSFSSKFSSSSAVETNTTVPSSPVSEPQKSQQSGGFLLSTLRRLSAPASNARDAFGRRGPAPTGGRCERVVLNRDMNRERCKIAELDASKLRKVAFCVDVEVAPSSEDVEARREARRKRREAREKEKEKLQELKPESSLVEGLVEGSNFDTVAPVDVDLSPAEKALKEKTEHKERKRRSSETSVPVNTVDNSVTPEPADSLSHKQDQNENHKASSEQTNEAEKQTHSAHHKRIHARPTTDPMKIYTQCCQLRETLLLPEMKEQLAKAKGVVLLPILDLSGHKFALCDAIALSDFLALVPVKRLIMDDCSLTDEMIRVILSGLGSVKAPSSVSKGKKREGEDDAGVSSPTSSTEPKQYRGAIERLSLKNNPKVGRAGWRYISCFIHMSHSLRAVDLSMIPLPRRLPVHGPPKNDSKEGQTPDDITVLFSKALEERLVGTGLDELIMGECELGPAQLKSIIGGVSRAGTKRLGLEGNSITDDGLALIGRWMKGSDTGGISHCQALDLSNNLLQEHADILSASVNEFTPLVALNLSNCNLSPTSLSSLLPALAELPNFRWLDLSNNPLLFSSQPDALPLLRQYLPQMKSLRKIGLAYTSMTPDHAIALSEVLPEIPLLAHVSLQGNKLFSPSGPGSKEGSLEEGAALFTALVAAVKVSKTIIRVDLDPLGSDVADVIKSLARRLVGFSLHNMEAGASDDDWMAELPGRLQSEAAESNSEDVVAHTAPTDFIEEKESVYEYDEHGVWCEEENFVVGGTGVVKALGVCLAQQRAACQGGRHHHHHPSLSNGNTPTLKRIETGASLDTLEGDEEGGTEKANEMSKTLLSRARKIKERIQPALRRAAHDDVEEMHHRRLLFLDETLHRVIQRFEEEYPECKIPAISVFETSSPPSSPSPVLQNSLSPQDLDEYERDDGSSTTTTISKPASRRVSQVSMHSRYLENEEGQMHRLGNYVRKRMEEDCKDVAVVDDDDANSPDDDDRGATIFRVVEHLEGEEIRRKVFMDEGGVDEVIRKFEGHKRERQKSRDEKEEEEEGIDPLDTSSRV